ncbi:MAG: hypothetical protein ABSG41_28185 [Bryobacteraceae bacterium]
MPAEKRYAQFMRTASVLFLLLVPLALFAGVANAQDGANTFRCPDGTVVPLEAKGRPYRCPDTDEQRAANARWKLSNEEAERHKKESDEWVANYKKENDERMAEFQEAYQEKVNAKASAKMLVAFIDDEIKANESRAVAERLAAYKTQGDSHDRIEAISRIEADNRVILLRLKDAPLQVLEKAEAAEAVARKKQAAAERAKLALICRDVFRATIDKKTGDLTVRETQQIKGCQTLDLYHQ